MRFYASFINGYNRHRDILHKMRRYKVNHRSAEKLVERISPFVFRDILRVSIYCKKTVKLLKTVTRSDSNSDLDIISYEMAKHANEKIFVFIDYTNDCTPLYISIECVDIRVIVKMDPINSARFNNILEYVNQLYYKSESAIYRKIMSEIFPTSMFNVAEAGDEL